MAEVATAWDNRGDIVVGNDVWIGYEAVILSGVTIGDGAIIYPDNYIYGAYYTAPPRENQFFPPEKGKSRSGLLHRPGKFYCIGFRGQSRRTGPAKSSFSYASMPKCHIDAP